MTLARRTAAVLATLALAAAPAAAQTVYSGTGASAASAQASFLAALTGPSYTENFEGLSSGTTSVTLPGVGTFGGGNGVRAGFGYGGGATSGAQGYELYN